MDERQKPTRQRLPGEVHPGVLYRADELKGRMGWSDAALRAARRRGLVVRREGKRAYVLGEDVITYITRAKGEPDD
jgi:hypothetical protein